MKRPAGGDPLVQLLDDLLMVRTRRRTFDVLGMMQKIMKRRC